MTKICKINGNTKKMNKKIIEQMAKLTEMPIPFCCFGQTREHTMFHSSWWCNFVTTLSNGQISFVILYLHDR